MSKWPQVRLKLVAKLGTGHTPSRQHPEYWENCTVPWLTLADVWQFRDGNRSVIDETSEKISELGLANSAAVKRSAGTVVLSRTASVGFSGILGRDMATSQDYVTWTCGPQLTPRYLLWALRGLRDEILGMRMGSTHQTIYMPDVERIRVPLPPISRQRAITDFLDAETARMDALIEKRTRMSALLEERISALVERSIRELSSTYGHMPLRYAVRRVEVGIVVTPAAWYADDGVIALRGVNVKPGDIDTADVVRISHEGHAAHSKSVLHAGDVVVVRTGQAGSAAVVPPEFDGANCIDLVIVRPSPSILPRYLEYVINSDWTQKHIEQHSVGTIQSHFNVAAMKQLPVPVPPLDVQEAVVGELDQTTAMVRSTLAATEQQVLLLTEHRQALITAAVTGQIEVGKE